MKKILFGLLAFSSLGANAQVDFTLKASNRPSDSLLIANRTTKNWLVAGKDGTFKSKLEITDGFYQLKLADQYTNLYLKNGQDLTATLDYNKFDETLRYSGGGAKENNFLAQRLLQQSDKDYDGAINAKDEATLASEINKIKEKILNSIPKDLDEAFVSGYKRNTEAQLMALTNYVYKSFETKKMNNSASPTFNYENHKGGTTKLEDFKGKYVYIDVWATWCGPCRAEIPHLKNLEKEMHGKNVEFVSISIDAQKDHDKWKKFVDDKQLGGVQLMADKDWNSDFVKAYGINGIPRFILIGPDGKIVNSDAPRPSSAEIKKILTDLTKS